MNELTQNQYWQLQEVAIYVDEIFVEMRKGVPQTRYILEVKPLSVYYDLDKNQRAEVDSDLVGYWMQKFPTDNRYDDWQDVVRNNGEFVKCKPIEVTTVTWEEL